MKQYKHTPFDEELLDAMILYNADKPSKDQFNLIDARIISLIHSYTYSGAFFFGSNQYLAEKCFSTPATIQKSINKLLDRHFINKRVTRVGVHKQRFLTYNEAAVEQFKHDVGLSVPEADLVAAPQAQ